MKNIELEEDDKMDGERFSFGAVSPNVAMITDNDEPMDIEEIVGMLNKLDNEVKMLKQALWEAETSYIHERYEYDFEVEQEIEELKKDWDKRYWEEDYEYTKDYREQKKF